MWLLGWVAYPALSRGLQPADAGLLRLELFTVGLVWQFVLSMMKLMGVIGSIALAMGLYSVIRHQPYHVCYPLLLGGVIYIVLFVGYMRTVGRRYAQLELRKMSAMDAR